VLVKAVAVRLVQEPKDVPVFLPEAVVKNENDLLELADA
jgi:hypothetical protein